MTGISVITRALRKIQAYGPGQTIPADEAQEALIDLNAMIDTWRAKRLMIYVTQEFTYTLVSGQQVYTIGPGGNFSQAWPASIAGVSVILLNNPDQPLELPLTAMSQQDWQQQIPVKTVASALPLNYYYERTFPLGLVKYWPIPNVTNLQTRLYVPTALTAFANLTDTYVAPPAYEEALVYNLAVRRCPDYGKSLDSVTAALAIEALTTIKTANTTLETMACDGALLSTGPGGEYNWRSDTGA